ncbi:MAG: zinc-binding dehydrogenase [Alphaproteobacteria bacterium]|nr:zinc-binding dehydrogenase [Alphaproteobacteria bacterium]
MKAVVLHEHGPIDKLRYEDIETPRPGFGEVLVRVTAAGVNHFDHDIREGVSGIAHKLPHIPGIEGVGEIAELGEGVNEVAVGNRVAINFFQSCGHCDMCLSGLDGICLGGKRIGVTTWGSYAEYCVCEARNVIALPDALADEAAAASMLCFGTAWHMTANLGAVRAGQDVLVNAAGSGVGSSAIQVAKLHGARVIASAGSTAKLDKARELGADHVIDYTTQDLEAEVMGATGGKGADLVIESVGGDILTASIAALAFNGRLITCGAHAGQRIDLDVIELFRKHIRIQGSHYASKREVGHVLGLVADGKLTPVIHRTLKLAEVQTAAAMMADRSVIGKMVLVP